MNPIILGRRSDLDGLRGVAVLAVMLGHASLIASGADLQSGTDHVPGLMRGGIFGVDIFFVLSGFLITTILLEEQAIRGKFSLRSFYIRRALRLLPALFLVLIASVIYVLLLKPDSVNFGLGVIALSGLYVSNFALMFEGVSLGMLTATWSLAVEEQFYTIWPLALIALRRLPRRVLLGLVIAGAIASAGFRLWCFLAAEAGPGVMFGTISLPARADGLLVGAAVAIMVTSDMLPKSARGLSALRWISGLAGLSLVSMLLLVTSVGPSLYYGTYALAGILTATLIAGLVGAPAAPLTAVLSWRPLAWIGRISYGLYLFHVPVYCLSPEPSSLLPPSMGVAVVTAGALACTFALAAASFYLVERRFLDLKDRIAGARIAPGPAIVAAAV
jgi:peptidoglycan/LPS O-acetylase OafA/YrhL